LSIYIHTREIYKFSQQETSQTEQNIGKQNILVLFITSADTSKILPDIHSCSLEQYQCLMHLQ